MKRILTLFIAVAIILPSQFALAEEKSDELVSAIAQLTAAIEHLSVSLDKNANIDKDDEALRKLDIAISYLNFRSRRIEGIERDIQQARSTKDRVEDFLTQMEQRKEAFQERVRNDPSISQDDIKQEMEDSDLRIQMMKDRMSSLDTEIIQHENKVSELQSQLDEVESFVSKSLKF